MEDKEAELQKFADQCDWPEVLKFYNKLYPNHIVDRDDYGPTLCLTQKADYMSSVGKTEEAIKIYETAIHITNIEEGQGEKSRRMQNLRQSLGAIYLAQHKYEEAMEIFKLALDNQIELFGDDRSNPMSQDLYETKLLIAMTLERQGKMVEALALYEEVYAAFVEFHGAEVDVTAHVGFNITSVKLTIAADAGALDLMTILNMIGYGPTVYSIMLHWDDGRDSVLHRAVRTNRIAVIQPVFEELVRSAETPEKLAEALNFENSEIQTPLTLAIKYDCDDAAKYLVQNGIPHGLDINKITQFGHTALQLAEYSQNETMKQLLLEHNAILPPWSD